jgi:hypothetical protein
MENDNILRKVSISSAISAGLFAALYYSKIDKRIVASVPILTFAASFLFQK